MLEKYMLLINQNNLTRENQIILLMITDGEKLSNGKKIIWIT